MSNPGRNSGLLKEFDTALKNIHQAGIPVVVITNQSVIGRGMISEDELSVIHDRMVKAVQKAGGRIAKIYYCPHHPDDLGANAGKPRIGLLKKAATGNGFGFDKMSICRRHPKRYSGRKPGRMPDPPGSNRTGEGVFDKNTFRKNQDQTGLGL